jgi:hypothetical protein
VDEQTTLADERLTETVLVQMSPEMRDEVRKAAAKVNRKESAFIRYVVGAHIGYYDREVA